MAQWQADIGTALSGLMGGYERHRDYKDKMALQQQQQERQAAQDAAMQQMRDFQIQQAQRQNLMQERTGQAMAAAMTGGLMGDTGRTPEERMTKYGMDADPLQYLTPQEVFYETPTQQRKSEIEKATTIAAINAKAKELGKKEPFVLFDTPEGGQDWVREGATIPKGWKKATGEARGTDLAYAVGPDGKGQYLSKTTALPEGFTWSTPAAEEKKFKAEEKETAAEKQKKFYAGVVLDDIDRAKTLIKEAKIPATGFLGAQAAKIPGTAAHDLDAILDSIRGNISFTRLQQMRESSPTGGALGAVSERELGLLSSVLGSLRQSQSEEELTYNLDRLEKAYDVIVNPQTKERLESTLSELEGTEVAQDYGYGKRADNTEKGLGFFGELKRPDGGISTELSIGINLDGKEVEIPLLVPTLNKEEVDMLLRGEPATREIENKAVKHAIDRIRQGKSPFAQKGEQQPIVGSVENGYRYKGGNPSDPNSWEKQ